MPEGEIIASKLITVIARQNWIDEESEPVLSEILEIAAQLDINIHNKQLWLELFVKAAELR